MSGTRTRPNLARAALRSALALALILTGCCLTANPATDPEIDIPCAERPFAGIEYMKAAFEPSWEFDVFRTALATERLDTWLVTHKQSEPIEPDAPLFRRPTSTDDLLRLLYAHLSVEQSGGPDMYVRRWLPRSPYPHANELSERIVRRLRVWAVVHPTMVLDTRNDGYSPRFRREVGLGNEPFARLTASGDLVITTLGYRSPLDPWLDWRPGVPLLIEDTVCQDGTVTTRTSPMSGLSLTDARERIHRDRSTSE